MSKDLHKPCYHEQEAKPYRLSSVTRYPDGVHAVEEPVCFYCACEPHHGICREIGSHNLEPVKECGCNVRAPGGVIEGSKLYYVGENDD